ncbi:MAG: C39 family peptidase [Atopobiaceae bacterium]|nr:C39 family peptidase [Atopobiaceae bacterium]
MSEDPERSRRETRSVKLPTGRVAPSAGQTGPHADSATEGETAAHHQATSDAATRPSRSVNATDQRQDGHPSRRPAPQGPRPDDRHDGRDQRAGHTSFSHHAQRGPAAARPSSEGHGTHRAGGNGIDVERATRIARHTARKAASAGKRTVRAAGQGDGVSIVKVSVAIIVLLMVVVGLSNCIRGCSSGSTDATTAASTADTAASTTDAAATTSRVATGIDEDVSASLSARLDQDDQLAWISEHAADYPYEKLLKLALKEPAAVQYVYDFLDHWGTDTTGQTYTENVTKGTYPELYQWDERWGYVSYADLPLGLSGCGPTSLSMAYMGLTGKTDKTPADMAKYSADHGYVVDGATSSELFTSGLDDLGLTSETLTVSTDALTNALSEGKVVIVSVKAGSRFTEVGHIMLVTALNSDGSVTLHDPNSTENTAQPWAPGTIIDDTVAMYAISYSG